MHIYIDMRIEMRVRKQRARTDGSTRIFDVESYANCVIHPTYSHGCDLVDVSVVMFSNTVLRAPLIYRLIAAQRRVNVLCHRVNATRTRHRTCTHLPCTIYKRIQGEGERQGGREGGREGNWNELIRKAMGDRIDACRANPSYNRYNVTWFIYFHLSLRVYKRIFIENMNFFTFYVEKCYPTSLKKWRELLLTRREL